MHVIVGPSHKSPPVKTRVLQRPSILEQILLTSVRIPLEFVVLYLSTTSTGMRSWETNQPLQMILYLDVTTCTHKAKQPTSCLLNTWNLCGHPQVNIGMTMNDGSGRRVLLTMLDMCP